MSPADALLSFERHATSKIKIAEDLFKLNTKGFLQGLILKNYAWLEC